MMIMRYELEPEISRLKRGSSILILFYFCFSYKSFLRRRQNWRQNTWGGWTVRQIQALARHFRPFLDAAREVLAAPDDDSFFKVLIFNMIRMLAILTVVGGVYALGQILERFMGTELVQEEEIVIVHEYATEEEAAKARAEQEEKDKKRQ
jgi:hypothetical protein